MNEKMLLVGTGMAGMYQIECPSLMKCRVIGNIHENPELIKQYNESV